MAEVHHLQVLSSSLTIHGRIQEFLRGGGGCTPVITFNAIGLDGERYKPEFLGGFGAMSIRTFFPIFTVWNAISSIPDIWNAFLKAWYKICSLHVSLDVSQPETKEQNAEAKYTLPFPDLTIKHKTILILLL